MGQTGRALCVAEQGDYGAVVALFHPAPKLE